MFSLSEPHSPGGVIEAYPPSDSVTCLTVDLLVEPGGEVQMLSCGDQLYGSASLQVAGYSVPQTSVCPDTLYFICMRVGQACQRRRILGHISLDLVTFLEPGTLEQQVRYQKYLVLLYLSLQKSFHIS